jgi:hypothetical protein
VRRFAIWTCRPLMVMPVTVQPWSRARWRVVPPMPHPTSRTVLLGLSEEISRRRLIKLVWPVSLVSVGDRK